MSPRCLNCGADNKGATGLDAGAPRPGDVAICLYCGHLMILDDALALRPPTSAELSELAGHPTMLAMMQARRAILATAEKAEKAGSVDDGSQAD